jgi:TM2 domain-containing membrane protein YozV
MTNPTEPPSPEPERFDAVAGLLALAFPGAGHLYLGQRRRAGYIALGVLGLFLGGLLIGGIDAIDRREDPVWFYGQVLVGPLTVGVDLLHQNVLKVSDGSGLPPRSATPEERAGPGVHASKSIGRMNELGTLYVTIAGMLNLIAVLDAFAHRRGGGWPSEHARRPGARGAGGGRG